VIELLGPTLALSVSSICLSARRASLVRCDATQSDGM